MEQQGRKERSRFPLYLQVLVAVLVGILVGQAARLNWPWFPRLESLGQLGELGKVIIESIKALAVPLIFFAIIDGLIRTRISPRHGWRLVLICVINVSVAFTVGLTLVNALQPGSYWREQLPSVPGTAVTATTQGTLSPIENFKQYIPATVIDPFLKNSVISAVILAVFVGAACRHVLMQWYLQRFAKSTSTQDDPSASQSKLDETPAEILEHPLAVLVNAIYAAFLKMLDWLIRLVPIAVFGAVANVVGKYGLEAFQGLLAFFGFVLLTLCIHALVYYTTVVWIVGRIRPGKFLSEGADAIMTGLSTNSSLATVPITLRCLTQGLGVSERSARLSTCIGTNLNNDGIMLYEAMAALFLAQAAGIELSFTSQLIILAASAMAGVGIAGIPEAGYVMLPLVLAVAGFSDEQIAVYWPLILPVDWVLARVRSGVNVMGDMTVAIILDRFEKKSEP